MNADPVASIIAGGLAAGDEIAGCTEQEIGALEAAFGRPLPSSYRAFLAVMGKGAGEFKQIKTSAPGIEISEHLPNIAGLMNYGAILRGMSTAEGAHPRA